MPRRATSKPGSPAATPGGPLASETLAGAATPSPAPRAASPNPRVDGFRDLVDHVAALKPTVIILGYGSVESFDGAAGLPAFAAGVDRLWAELARTGARIVVLTPNRQENLGPPLPDPAAHNADLAQYAALLQTEAARRGAPCVDLFTTMHEDDRADPGPWTTNGIHLAPDGYWKAASVIDPVLFGAMPPAPLVAITDGKATATGATVTELALTPTGLKFRVTADFLPEPPQPDGYGPAVHVRLKRPLRVAGLAPGKYQLRVDGEPLAASGDTGHWERGIDVFLDPEVKQVEALRAAINRKNLLYFHRWRPQNETYLFGFRKHEQGQNAAELAAFDPQVAAAEAEIGRLSRPVAHTYELVRLPEGEVAR